MGVLMKASQIIETLEEWNFWNEQREIGVRRGKYLDKMKRFSQTGQVVTLTGVRRCGKSTLMMQFIKDLVDKDLPVKNTLYVNLEDPRFWGSLSLKFLNDLFETYVEYLKPDRMPYVFIDEVQHVTGWEKFVRFLQEARKGHVFVSGSASTLSSPEFGTALTGRHLPLTVCPLDFAEFLSFREMELRNRLDIVRRKVEIKRLLKEYLEFGGFPKVALSKEKKEILCSYFEDIIARDVVERNRIVNIEEAKILAKYYLTNISGLATFGKIKNFLKIPLHTVERFSSYLTNANLVFLVKKFSYSLKEQQVNPRKVFAVDCGLRNVVGFKFSPDLGKLYENAAFSKLHGEGKDVYYWKNKRECDFLVRTGSDKELIQVCCNLDDPAVKEREIDGLSETMEKFNIRQGIIITQDQDEEEKIRGKMIKFIPLWKWLLL